MKKLELFLVAITVFYFLSFVGAILPETQLKRVDSEIATLTTFPSLDKLATSTEARIAKLTEAEEALQEDNERWATDLREAFNRNEVDVEFFKERLINLESRNASIQMAKENIPRDSLADAW